MSNIPNEERLTFRPAHERYLDTRLIDVAGHTFEILAVSTGVSRCGDIEDGVSLAHWKVEAPCSRDDSQGGWVIRFADLEAWYFAAKAKRDALTALDQLKEKSSGTCDTVEQMERGDPYLAEARAAIALARSAPETSVERCEHGAVVCERCARVSIAQAEKCPGHYKVVARNVCTMFPHCLCSPEARAAEAAEDARHSKAPAEQMQCQACHGNGRWPDQNHECPNCGGTGKARSPFESASPKTPSALPDRILKEPQ